MPGGRAPGGATGLRGAGPPGGWSGMTGFPPCRSPPRGRQPARRG
jgi:hypothetical protein